MLLDQTLVAWEPGQSSWWSGVDDDLPGLNVPRTHREIRGPIVGCRPQSQVAHAGHVRRLPDCAFDRDGHPANPYTRNWSVRRSSANRYHASAGIIWDPSAGRETRPSDRVNTTLSTEAGKPSTRRIKSFEGTGSLLLIALGRIATVSPGTWSGALDAPW